MVNGTTYNEANPTGTEVLTNFLGCDSTVTVTLVYNAVSLGVEPYTGCAGDGYSVVVNGTTYNEANPTGTEVLTNFLGCDSTVAVTLVFNPTSTGSEVYTGCQGDGYSVTVNGTTYNETNPTGTEVLTNSLGCDSTVTITLTYNNNPTPSITGPSVFCNGSSFTLDAGTGYVDYDWGTAGTGQTITTTVGGSYTVTVTDANGCTGVANTTVTEITLALDEVHTDETCDDSNDGTISLTPSGGTAPYNYNWSGGVSTGSFANGLNEGTYTVTVTDGNGCTISTSVTITAPEPIVITLIDSSPSNCLACDGAANISITGGSGNYNINWSNGSTVEDPFDLCGGLNLVTVVDDQGCTGSLEVPISINGSTLVVDTIIVENATCVNECDGQAIALISGGQEPYAYQWDANAGGQTTQTAFDLCAGSYSVTVTDADGCDVVGIAIITEPTLVESAFYTIDVGCFGESNGAIVVDSTFGGTPPYYYSLDGDLYIPDTIFSNLPAGDYTVYTQDANGCVVMNDVTVDEPAELVLTVSEDTLIQFGESVDLFALPNLPDVAIEWTVTDSLSCTDCSLTTASPTTSILYEIIATDTVNMCTVTEQILVRVEIIKDVYVPNAFSPNNDGNNDFVTVYGDEAKIVQVENFRIFDRWGEMVHEANNFPINDLSFGWDGTFKGKNMDPAVFVYFAEVRFIDGTVQLVKGDITLLR